MNINYIKDLWDNIRETYVQPEAGYTQRGVDAMNVTDLGTPLGNIQNATLYLNTCHSNSSGS